MQGRWSDGVKALGASWFALTPDERRALGLILALACLGLAVKVWHVSRKPAPDASPAATAPR